MKLSNIYRLLFILVIMYLIYAFLLFNIYWITESGAIFNIIRLSYALLTFAYYNKDK